MTIDETRISMALCKKRLAIVWFTGSGLLFFLVLLLTIVGTYKGKYEDAWSWLLPSFMPTLSLIIGILVADSSKTNQDTTVDRFMFQLSFGLSVSYLVMVSLTILLSPFSKDQGPLGLMRTSNLWLAPVQGLVSAALGAFFISKKA